LSAIHKRLHAGQKKEFKLVSQLSSAQELASRLSLRRIRRATWKLNKLTLMREWMSFPVSNPDIFSTSQRISNGSRDDAVGSI
jgi:hypothetical protein